METTPATYFRFFVEPNWEDFHERPDDLRRGFNAAVSAFQMSDIYWSYFERHDPSRLSGFPEKRAFLSWLAQRTPAFLTVQAAATVYKHLYGTRAYVEVGSPMALFGVVSAREGVEVTADWPPSGGPFVSVMRKDGSKASLNAALKELVEGLWPEVLGPDLYAL